MDTLVNASFASPLANADLKIATVSSQTGLLTTSYNGLNAWTVALTILLTLVAYDQCAPSSQEFANAMHRLTDIAQSNTYG
jgi:hypothetical protein